MSNNEIIIVNGLKKFFGNVKAVNGISFKVRQGEVFGLLGPNGAGKTTTIKLLLGLLEPNEGEMSVFGLNPERDEVEIKKRIGYVSEEPLIFKSLTPQNLFNFIASIRGLEEERTTILAKEYMESLEAIDYYDQLIATLSHGNKQKLQIIAAILHEPDLLILDEPIAGLTSEEKDETAYRITEIQGRYKTAVLLVEHDLRIASRLADRMIALDYGQKIAQGSPEEVQRTPEVIKAYLGEE